MATIGNTTYDNSAENSHGNNADTQSSFTDNNTAMNPGNDGKEIVEEAPATNTIDTTFQCTINDTETPILVLFGPSQCGKSMTMVRLVRYLKQRGYSVDPRRDFRPSDDHIYELRCQEFNNTISTYTPLPGTVWQDFMLATVIDSKGNSVLQILEAPGEAYFSLVERFPLKKPYPAYLNKIKACRAPKIWCFFTEPDWKAAKYHDYVERIKNARSFIDLRKDKIIILYNKVDKLPQFINFGKINNKAVIKFVDQQYKGLFQAFKNTRLGESLWKPYLCEFVPFSTGDYSDGTFTESNDRYPYELLKKIL